MFAGVFAKKDGAGHGVRTRDIQLGKQNNRGQNTLKTLGKTKVTTRGVTQSVTHNTKKDTREALLQVLQALPKDELIYLLTETIKKL